MFRASSNERALPEVTYTRSRRDLYQGGYILSIEVLENMLDRHWSWGRLSLSIFGISPVLEQVSGVVLFGDTHSSISLNDLSVLLFEACTTRIVVPGEFTSYQSQLSNAQPPNLQPRTGVACDLAGSGILSRFSTSFTSFTVDNFMISSHFSLLPTSFSLKDNITQNRQRWADEAKNLQARNSATYFILLLPINHYVSY